MRLVLCLVGLIAAGSVGPTPWPFPSLLCGPIAVALVRSCGNTSVICCSFEWGGGNSPAVVSDLDYPER